MSLPVLDLVTTDIHSGSATNPTYNFNHTVSGSQRLLIVQVTYSMNAAGSVSSVSYNGTALTFLAKKQQFNNGALSEACVEVWYLIAPATGTNQVSVVMSGTFFSVKNAAISWTNTDQSSPIDGGTAQFQTGSHTTYTASMTTANANEVVVTAFDHIYMPNSGSSSQNSLWNNNSGGDHWGAASYQNVTGSGTAVTDQYSIANQSSNLQAEVSIIFGIKQFVDTTPPSVPIGLAAVRTASQVALSWNASSDNVGVTGYRIYRGGTLYQDVGNVLSYNDTSISSSTAYTYTVTAYDAAGNESAQSSPVTAGVLVNEKFYLFKVYNSAGTTLIKTWTDVVSDPEFSVEINGAGSQMQVTLKRDPTNFGEGSDVNYQNQVQVYCFDTENASTGVRIFIGKIVDYTPDYTNNEVQVMLLGYGSELDQFMYESSQSVTTYSNIQFVQAATTNWVNQTTFSVSITPTAGNMLLLALILPSTVTGEGVQAVGDTQGNSWVQDNVSAWRSVYKNGYAFFRWATNVAGGATTVSGFFVNSAATPIIGHQTTGHLHILEYSGVSTQSGGSTLDPDYLAQTGGSGGTMSATGITTSLASDLLAELGVDDTNNAPTATGDGFTDRSTYSTADYSTVSSKITGSIGAQTATMHNFSGVNSILMALAFKPNSTTITAEVVDFAYTATDPATMARAIMDNYIAQGGVLTYTTSTIPLTGQLVDYTFSNNSILEALKMCQALMPAGWYWYVDQANNVVYFKQKTQSGSDVTFTVGKDIQGLTLEHREEAVINKVFVTGGQINGGTNLYYKYTNSSSISSYGPWMDRYNNSNVTTSGTSFLIANAILTNHSAPEVRTTVELADSNGNTGGYDLESIAVNGIGKVATFRNTGNTATDSLTIQISRFDYKPDKMTLVLSTVPPDVTKKLDNLARLLDAQATIDNPTYARTS
jgi:hypothetical protein